MIHHVPGTNQNPAQQTWRQATNARFQQALWLSGLSVQQLQNLLPFVQQVLPESFSAEQWYALAAVLSCDARWLATGELAPGCAETIARLEGLQQRISTVDRLRVKSFLESCYVPASYPGQCIYCGCTDEFGCGDCYWVNEEATICSACLTPEV